jgi:DNA-directed RNA polymerase specialized sigma24 family protein
MIAPCAPKHKGPHTSDHDWEVCRSFLVARVRNKWRGMGEDEIDSAVNLALARLLTLYKGGRSNWVTFVYNYGAEHVSRILGTMNSRAKRLTFERVSHSYDGDQNEFISQNAPVYDPDPEPNAFYDDTMAAMDWLNDEQRQILDLKVYGFISSEIAQMYGVTRQAVDSRLKTVGALLRAHMESDNTFAIQYDRRMRNGRQAVA